MSTTGPEWVALTFKVLAIIAILGGTVTAFRVGGSDLSVRGVVVAGVVGGTVFTAAALLFFAYVLDLLVDIRDNADIVADMSLTPEDEEVS